ncbi:MAG TPA: hypothetical protein VG939_02780, partial [Caulobacteraceae bacterium]|nr:hypothetical protein [Caulobacteraceae bacterium]
RSALEASLAAADYLATDADGAKLDVTASLIDLEQPLVGLDITVTSRTRYTVKDRTTGQVVFDQTIAASGDAKLASSLIAIERLKKANELAIQANIQAFIEQFDAALKARRTAQGG